LKLNNPDSWLLLSDFRIPNSDVNRGPTAPSRRRLLVVGAGQALGKRRLAVGGMSTSEDFDAHVALASRAIAHAGLVAQVAALAARGRRREGAKRLRRRLSPIRADPADGRRHPLILNVHPRVRAVIDLGFALKLASRMARRKRHGQLLVVSDLSCQSSVGRLATVCLCLPPSLFPNS
jgi:hypothetical protein